MCRRASSARALTVRTARLTFLFRVRPETIQPPEVRSGRFRALLSHRDEFCRVKPVSRTNLNAAHRCPRQFCLVALRPRPVDARRVSRRHNELAEDESASRVTIKRLTRILKIQMATLLRYQSSKKVEFYLLSIRSNIPSVCELSLHLAAIPSVRGSKYSACILLC